MIERGRYTISIVLQDTKKDRLVKAIMLYSYHKRKDAETAWDYIRYEMPDKIEGEASPGSAEENPQEVPLF